MAQLATEGTEGGPKQCGTFVFPQIHDNLDGWGPCEVPEQFRDTPYQPFSKDDRLGKVRSHGFLTCVYISVLFILRQVADWSGNMYTDRRSASKSCIFCMYKYIFSIYCTLLDHK